MCRAAASGLSLALFTWQSDERSSHFFCGSDGTGKLRYVTLSLFKCRDLPLFFFFSYPSLHFFLFACFFSLLSGMRPSFLPLRSRRHLNDTEMMNTGYELHGQLLYYRHCAWM